MTPSKSRSAAASINSIVKTEAGAESKEMVKVKQEYSVDSKPEPKRRRLRSDVKLEESVDSHLKTVAVKLEPQTVPNDHNSDTNDDKKGESLDTTTMNPRRSPPKNWEEIYKGIKAYRNDHVAPVDIMGCDQLASRDVDSKQFRYQTLVALQLSSQTKDEVTAAAVANLKQACPGGLSVDGILAMDPVELDQCIAKVGFHNRKTIYLRQTAQILRDEYGSDIPSTLQGLMALPGVGPKMAHLTMQAAWGQVTGIGVDTHVHRISNRLRWVSTATRTPEHTRNELEEWLPRHLWDDINVMLVGFGQTLCRPVGPKCSECPVRSLCPKVGVGRSKSNTNR